MIGGIQVDDTVDDDLYSMLIPAEQEHHSSGKGCRTGGTSGATEKQHRRPFDENLPYDNLYQF